MHTAIKLCTILAENKLTSVHTITTLLYIILLPPPKNNSADAISQSINQSINQSIKIHLYGAMCHKQIRGA